MANRNTASALGTEAPREKPENVGERIAHRVGEEVGVFKVPTGAAVRAGKLGVERRAPRSRQRLDGDLPTS